ncbi:serine protease FAM111A-like isoform X2 [Triplophysa rosa]|uniref:serine protease FAM111A-like isoform X2 n=1 Tax=Triplophysa rosa TaxID=992332 RepID=UPI00254637D3|nr:serine protease FAM111A-like isoform X2 [Triplophysa rosa]
MPQRTPAKKMKMKSMTDFFPKKETESDPKSRKVLNDLSNAQNTEGKSHKFQFRYKKTTHAVAGDPSKTVLDALETNKTFRKIEKENAQKEIVLQRSRGDVPQAAVKTDFPFCLIDKDEIIDVNFIKKHDAACMQKKPTRRPTFPNKSENLVSFYIKTKGKGKMKGLMMNGELYKNDVDYVCVYAFNKDTLITALKRDGRFRSVIFEKHCVLSEFGSDTVHDMAYPVKHLNRKHFLMVISNSKNQSDSQDDAKENADPNQHTEDDKKTNNVAKCTTRDRLALKKIPDSKELENVLRNDMRCYLEQRSVGDTNIKVQNFFRAEYDKGVESFSEVKKVKEIMRLSSSVCQIRTEGCVRGTGFLLFDRFILTNAHVIEDFDRVTRKLFKTFTAVFGFEDLGQAGIKSIAVKEHAVACYRGDDEMMRHLDFALLELDVTDHEALDCPELLTHYSYGRPPNRGGVCIVGHPDGGVKRMDLCFIISREDQPDAVNKHVSQNINYYHVITQESLAQKWKTHDNQIMYDTCFFHGSSGSPVFDESCHLIGVHTGGYVYRGAKDFNLNMEDNDVEMTEEPQHQDEYEQ